MAPPSTKKKPHKAAAAPTHHTVAIKPHGVKKPSTSSWCPRWFGGYTTLDKQKTTSHAWAWCMCIFGLMAVVGIVVGALAATGKFKSSSSSGGGSGSGGTTTAPTNSDPDAVFDYPLRTDYTDTTGNTQAAPIDTSVQSCVPSFATNELPNGQYGTTWYNPCNTNDQGIAITGGAMPASFTLSAVFNPTPINPRNVIMFYGSGQTTGATFYIQYAVAQGFFNGGMGNGILLGNTAYSVQENTWIHLVLTYDASLGVATLYVDGQAVGTPTQVTPAVQTAWGTDGDTTMRSMPVIGGFHGGDFDFTGYIYNAHLESGVMSATDIATLYNNDFNNPGGTSTTSTSTGGGGTSSIYSSSNWWNNPSLLYYYYPFTTNMADSTGHTTGSIAGSTTSACVPTISNAAWYNPCDSLNQGFVLTGTATGPSFSFAGMFQIDSQKTTNIFMLVGSNRVGNTGITTPVGYALQFDLTTNVWQGAVTGVGLFVPNVAGTFSPNRWYHIVHTFDGSSGLSSLYVNGQLFHSYTVPTLVLSDWTAANAQYPQIVLGGYLGDGCYNNDCSLTGYLSQQRGFNVALPAAQVAQLYTVDQAATSS